MKQLVVVAGLCIFGWLTWLLGSRLSSDALGMAVGLLFGVLAGIPTALLVLASGRHPERRTDDDDEDDIPRAVTIVYNTHTDNRQLTISTVPAPEWPQKPIGMPLLSDRQRQIAAQREEW